MNETEYRQLKRMNASTLVHGLHSMKRLQRVLDEQPMTPTDAMQLGTAIHYAILEPGEFNARYVVMPDFHRDPANVTAGGKASNSKATSYYRQRCEQFEAENVGKTILSEWQMQVIMCCLKETTSKPGMLELLKSCQKEVVLLGEIDGVECKGRVDLLGPNYLGDLKTTQNAEPRAFGRVYCDLRYSFRLAFYRELARQNGYQIERVQVIAQETIGDFDCVVYDVPDIAIDVAFRKVRSVLNQYKECLVSGVWPGLDGGSGPMLVHLPPWELEVEDELEWSETDSESEVAF